MSATAAPIAALPMYDYSWVREATDALWAGIAARLRRVGIDAPARLTRGGDLEAQWRGPALIFGQTCGYPYVERLRDEVALIAAPRYTFPGCAGATHRSFLVASAAAHGRVLADFRSARAAVNVGDSNSGMNLFRAAVAPLAGGRPFFSEIVLTGAHVKSLEAVAEGRADVAAIDCVSFALIGRGRPDLVVRIATIGETAASPTLPFIASAQLPAPSLTAIREALFAALADPALAAAREVLGLACAVPVAPADYDGIAALEREAIAAGYPRLV